MTRLLGSRVVRLVVAIGLTSYIFWRSDPQAIFQAAAAADPRWLVLACGLVLFDRALMAWRWIALLRPVTAGAPVPFGALMRVFFVSSFLGTFLPASIGGDAVRAFSLTRYDVPAHAALASVAMDRALGVVSILILGGVSVATLPAAAPLGVHVILACGGLASAVLAATIFVTPLGDAAARLTERLPHRRVRALAGRLVAAMRAYRHHHAALAAVTLASLGVQVLRVLQAWCLGRAIGIDAPLAVYFVAIPVIVLIMQVPITVNGLGTGQAAFVWTFRAAGVLAPPALALSILFIALGIVGNLPGGLLYATGGRREVT